MDIGRAFSYVFDDENWITTVLIGGLLMIIPIFGQIVLIGFLFETARNVMAGNPRPLPTWSNIGEKFTQGLYGFVIGLVYALPIILLTLVFVCITALSAVAAGNDSSSGAGALAGLAGLCFFPLIFILALVIQPMVLAAYGRFVRTNNLRDALRIGDTWATLRADLGGWLMLWLLQILCGFVAGAGAVAFGIGALFTTVYAQAVFGHLLGQYLRRNSQPAGATYDYMPPAPPPAF